MSDPLNDSKLLERIDKAIKRITNGEGMMRVPPDPTDPDLVLADCRTALLARHPEPCPGPGFNLYKPSQPAAPSVRDRERAASWVIRFASSWDNAALIDSLAAEFAQVRAKDPKEVKKP
jgi:hypothetical protein